MGLGKKQGQRYEYKPKVLKWLGIGTIIIIHLHSLTVDDGGREDKKGVGVGTWDVLLYQPKGCWP